MGLKMRIWLSPAIAMVVFIVGGFVVALITGSADSAITALGGSDYPYLDQTNRFSIELDALQAQVTAAVAQGEKGKLAEAEATSATIHKVLAAMQATDKHKKEAQDLSAQFDAYYTAANATARIFLDIDKGDGGASVAVMQKAQEKLKTTLATMQTQAVTGFNEGLVSAHNGVRRSVWAMSMGAVVVLLALGGGSYLLVQSLWRQIGGEPAYARKVLNQMARGDLAQDIAVAPRADQSVLAAVREMSGSLARMISDVRGGTERIADASQEIASGNQDLSNRTEEQAASLQKTAASMEQISSTVKHSAENAKQATRIALQASEAADNGGSVVGQVITTMDDILVASKKIAEIVGVIDGIAFQTNILALNAAVEAARAGEDGRGFAVVAGEVRNLAQRSAQAAKEIKNMISESVQKVDAGSVLVHQAGTAMTDIVAQVKRVNDLIAEISQAAVEQSAGISQVTDAVTQMDNVTQQNAALVEQSAAAAASMRSDSSALAQAVSAFKVSQGESTATA
jgi:methyl-accepting chemotaxis protein